MKKYLLTGFLAFILILNSCSRMKTRADLIVHNARIYIVDSAMTVAGAIAVKGGKIIAMGSDSQILGAYSYGNIIDCRGNAVFPGFIDAHCHFYGYAVNMRNIDLSGSNSFAEVLGRLKKSVLARTGEWIVGRGWDQNLWGTRTFPDRMELDKQFPHNPVILIRTDGHVVLANKTALQLAGIETNHKFQPGEVEIKEGRLTGILSENAADHIRNIVPVPDRKELKSLFVRAQNNCFAVGLTAVSDAGLDAGIVRLYDLLDKDSTLKIGIYAMLNPTAENFNSFIRNGPMLNEKLRVRSVKLYADGSLGSRTALLKHPYSDMPNTQGIRVTSPDSIRKVCRLCLEHGYQVNTHAIGDSANKLVLDIYGEFLRGKNDRRWRIEHCQVVDAEDLYKFQKYAVIPSIQATHATSDMNWAVDRLGPQRVKTAYAYKALLAQNGWVANGTDFPVENISPLFTFYASVTRKNINGLPEGGFQIENALSREEALRSITIWAAMADFWENETGSLEPGKKADFVILDQDIMEVSEDKIPDTRVISTYISGMEVYKKP